MSLAIFRLETLACAPSRGKFRFDISFGNFRLRFFALKYLPGNFSRGSFVWQRYPVIFWLIHSAWTVSRENFRRGSFAWELSLGILRLGTYV